MNKTTISRQGVLDLKQSFKEKKMQIVIDNYFKSECDVNTTIRQAFEKGFRIGVEKVSSAQPEQRWTPCSEGMPEHTDWVIVTKLDTEEDVKSVCPMWYSERNGREWDKSILAWMPMPEPYKESEK